MLYLRDKDEKEALKRVAKERGYNSTSEMVRDHFLPKYKKLNNKKG